MFNRSLGKHPDILALNELHFVGKEWRAGQDEQWTEDEAQCYAAKLISVARRSIWNAKPTDKEKLEAQAILAGVEVRQRTSPLFIYGEVLSFLLRKAGKKLVTDQTPMSILHVKAILEEFPNAKVIQLLRDPRAVVLSQKNRWRQRKLGARETPLKNALRVYANYHPFTATKLWISAYKKGKAVASNPRYMCVHFEELVEAPRLQLEKVCRFLGIQFDPVMLDVPQVGSSNFEHREDTIGISPAVIDAWRTRLSGAELWICEAVASSSMREAGYTPTEVRLPLLGLTKQILLYPLHVFGVLAMNPRLAVRIYSAAHKEE
jgi:hypothetical protein